MVEKGNSGWWISKVANGEYSHKHQNLQREAEAKEVLEAQQKWNQQYLKVWDSLCCFAPLLHHFLVTLVSISCMFLICWWHKRTRFATKECNVNRDRRGEGGIITLEFGQQNGPGVKTDQDPGPVMSRVLLCGSSTHKNCSWCPSECKSESVRALLLVVSCTEMPFFSYLSNCYPSCLSQIFITALFWWLGLCCMERENISTRLAVRTPVYVLGQLNAREIGICSA